MSRVAELLRQKADDYHALCEEHHETGDPQRVQYAQLELTFRELAEIAEEVEQAA